MEKKTFLLSFGLGGNCRLNFTSIRVSLNQLTLYSVLQILRVQLLTVQHRFLREYCHRTVEDWCCVTWSDEFHFYLFRIDNWFRVLMKPNDKPIRIGSDSKSPQFSGTFLSTPADFNRAVCDSIISINIYIYINI